MAIEWIKETFGTQKPFIAMCHFQPLPGDPMFRADGLKRAVDSAGRNSWTCRRAA
jgi:predicted TIM-barrel enzyme